MLFYVNQIQNYQKLSCLEICKQHVSTVIITFSRSLRKAYSMPRRRTLRRISDEDEFETAAFRITQNADELSKKRRFSDSESNDGEELESGEGIN